MIIQRRKFLTSRRYKDAIWGSSKDATNKRNYPPGMHGTFGYRRLSDFGTQVKAKRQLMTHYNIGERQFRKFFDEASRKKGNRGENFAAMLESRLSMVLYRAKFTNTIYAAQQLITHGHVQVNDRKIDRPGYRVFPGSKITIKKRMTNKQNFLLGSHDGSRDIPDYIQVADSGDSFCFVRLPTIGEIPFVFTAETFSKIISCYS